MWLSWSYLSRVRNRESTRFRLRLRETSRGVGRLCKERRTDQPVRTGRRIFLRRAIECTLDFRTGYTKSASLPAGSRNHERAPTDRRADSGLNHPIRQSSEELASHRNHHIRNTHKAPQWVNRSKPHKQPLLRQIISYRANPSIGLLNSPWAGIAHAARLSTGPCWTRIEWLKCELMWIRPFTVGSHTPGGGAAHQSRIVLPCRRTSD